MVPPLNGLQDASGVLKEGFSNFLALTRLEFPINFNFRRNNDVIEINFPSCIEHVSANLNKLLKGSTTALL